jgi:hypothetical protein
MYPCRVEKRVWHEPDRSSGYTRLFFHTEVESAPTIGLELEDGHWFSGPLNFVIWDLDNECFVCRVEDEFPVFEQDYKYTHGWIVDNYLLQGWSAEDA